MGQLLPQFTTSSTTVWPSLRCDQQRKIYSILRLGKIHTLECRLPPPTSGTVKVTHSPCQEPGNPPFGNGHCWLNYHSEHDHLSVAPCISESNVQQPESRSYEILRVIEGLGHDVTRPGIARLPAGREFLHRATHPTHPTVTFRGWILQFLASLAETPSWENTVSLVNEHHQTLAHPSRTVSIHYPAQKSCSVGYQCRCARRERIDCTSLRLFVWRLGFRWGLRADEDIQDDLGRRLGQSW